MPAAHPEQEEYIVVLQRLALSTCLLTLLSLLSACVVTTRDRYHEGYREGYYDRDHHRWYHNHAWADCEEHDRHCHE